MKQILVCCLALGLVACGPDWSGTFVGSLTTIGTCSDGSAVPESKSAVQVKLVDEGETVTWDAACGATAIADITDEIAFVRQYSCPADTQPDGTVVNATIDRGTIELVDDNTLKMDLESTIVLSGTITGSCGVILEGSLSRLDE